MPIASDEITQLAYKLSLFEGLPWERIGVLLTGAEQKMLRHKEVLFRAGERAETFAIVLEGGFKLVKATTGGEKVIVFFATPGNVVAALLMSIPESVYPVSVAAMGASTVLTVPRETYVSHWASDQGLMSRIHGQFLFRIGEMHDQKTLAKAPLARKVAWQIVSLIERYDYDGETELPIPLTRAEIADSLGASVESVIRIMSEWSREGILETSEKRIHVLRMDKILEILKGAVPGG